MGLKEKAFLKSRCKTLMYARVIPHPGQGIPKISLKKQGILRKYMSKTIVAINMQYNSFSFNFDIFIVITEKA